MPINNYVFKVPDGKGGWTGVPGIGIPGDAAKVTLGEVTTGAPGTEVKITNTGSSAQDAVFNFAIPRGANIQLRGMSGYIQWKTEAEETWHNLFSFGEIQGATVVISVTSGTSFNGVILGNGEHLYSESFIGGTDGYGYFLNGKGEFTPITLKINGEIQDVEDGFFAPTVAGTTGQILTSSGGGAPEWKNIDTDIDLKPSNSIFYLVGATDGSSVSELYYNPDVYVDKGVMYGACWNDYAEYREVTGEWSFGRVVCENGDDTLSLSTRRLQAAPNIVSDTFGYAIGKTHRSTVPIAVSGRVLAFPYEDRKSFRAGDPVCAGPNGTVSKMTREEIIQYPDRMIGTVSAIPQYSQWGTGKIQINNRIWIKIK